MAALLAFSRSIDHVSRVTGIVATWLVLLASLVSAFNALFRYSISSIIWLDTELRVFGGGLGFLLDLYRERCSDYGPKLFAEMILDHHASTFKRIPDHETIRRWLLKAGL